MNVPKFKVAITSTEFDRYKGKKTTLLSTNSFTIGQFWDREVELEFNNGETLPFEDIDWERDQVRYLQYSGLKDCDGVPIYEGAIYALPHTKPKKVGQIFLSNGCFLAGSSIENSFPLGYDCDWERPETDFSWIKVIGHIYQNPSILKNYKKKV